MSTLFAFAFILLLVSRNAVNMAQVDTEVNMMKENRGGNKKVIERISRHIHPHDDEPDPTAYMGNYNFPQMLFAFCLGFATMFVLAVEMKSTILRDVHSQNIFKKR